MASSPQTSDPALPVLLASEGDEGPRKHRKYYIPTGDVVFKIENTLFRAHRYFFERESAIFRDMLSLPAPIQTMLQQPPDSTANEGMSTQRGEGLSDENPIHLPQVTSKEFEQFLWVFYNPTHFKYDAPSSTWISILRLAHLWDFRHVSELSFEKLENEPAAKRLALAERYDGPSDWRAHAMAELVMRQEPLSRADGEELGMDLILQIAEMRERQRSGSRWDRRSYRAGRRTGRPEDYMFSPPRSRTRSRSRSPSPPVIMPAPHWSPPPPPPPHIIIPHTPPPIVIAQPPMPHEWNDVQSVTSTNVSTPTQETQRMPRRKRIVRFFKNTLRKR